MEKKSNFKHKFIIITAPSGAGKTTIAHELIRQFSELVFSISVTTRLPRKGETKGKDYYFISVDEFERKIAEKDFVEYEKVYEGKCYGTLYSELERIWRDHKYPLRVVDVKGAKQLKRIFGDAAVSIFIKPPSFEVLKQRLINRGMDDEKSMKERLGRALKEMEFEHDFDHVVLNDVLAEAVEETFLIVKDFIYSE